MIQTVVFSVVGLPCLYLLIPPHQRATGPPSSWCLIWFQRGGGVVLGRFTGMLPLSSLHWGVFIKVYQSLNSQFCNSVLRVVMSRPYHAMSTTGPESVVFHEIPIWYTSVPAVPPSIPSVPCWYISRTICAYPQPEFDTGWNPTQPSIFWFAAWSTAHLWHFGCTAGLQSWIKRTDRSSRDTPGLRKFPPTATI